MCPPVNVRYGSKGMPCLYAEWLYQLVHRDQMKICFACFKAAFLENRRLLAMQNWEEEPWEDKNLELSGSGTSPEEDSEPEEVSEQEEESQPEEESELQEKSQPANESDPKEECQPEEKSDSGEESQVEDWLGQSWAEGQENKFHITVDVTNPDILTPGSIGTELQPEEAELLDPRPEDYDKYWAYPWKLGRFSPCPHQCIIPPLSFWDIFNKDLHSDEHLLLELSHIWPTNQLVESCLKKQNFFLVLCGSDTGWYLVSMNPLWVVRTQVNRWQMMLDPDALLVFYLETGPQKQDMNRWRLSMLESSELGLELVPADCTLRKKGFKVHSYLPWQSETLKDWGREPGERLFIKHIRILKNY